MGKNPSSFKGEQRPVEQVSWNEVQDFIKRLNDTMPGLTAHLPTEAEWEYACRAGTITPFSFGEDITSEQVNYDGRSPYRSSKEEQYRKEAVEVASLPANSWGLYEMHGNVWEWCQDWHGDYPQGLVIDPTGPVTGGEHILRGGSALTAGCDVRSAYRERIDPSNRFDILGFRFALDPDLSQSRREGA